MSPSDPLFGLQDTVVLVAGAGSGFGAPAARELAARGAKLMLTDLDADRARPALPADLAPERGAVAAMDICDEAAIARAIQACVDRFGRLDGVVNAAGVFHIAPAETLDAADFRRTLEANLVGPFLLTRVAARAMAGRGGRIVHLASVSAQVANPDYAAYAASKAGLAQAVRVMARELAPKRITVNAIGPAMTETGLTAPYLADPDWLSRARSQIPMDRLGTPQDILATLILLLAPGGAFITGQTIYPDGGRTLV